MVFITINYNNCWKAQNYSEEQSNALENNMYFNNQIFLETRGRLKDLKKEVFKSVVSESTALWIEIDLILASEKPEPKF